jgi:hypothetical protein
MLCTGAYHIYFGTPAGNLQFNSAFTHYITLIITAGECLFPPGIFAWTGVNKTQIMGLGLSPKTYVLK